MDKAAARDEEAFVSACRQGNQKRIRELVEAGSVDPTVTFLWRSFLGYACEGGDVDTIKLMIDTYGCDPEGRNHHSSNSTPLQEACKAGRSKAVDLLVGTYHCDMYRLREKDGKTAFDVAVENGRLDVVDLLLKTHKYDPNHRNSKGCTPLHTAAEHGSSEVMKKLIETYKADPECKDDEGRTPLHTAVEYGRNEMIKELIETYKADPECKDNEGRTPLACAVANDKHTTATLLIDECKCDLQCRDSKGYNLLHVAAVKGKSGMAKLLLVTKYKFDPNVKAADGSTPLHLTKHASTAEELIRHGADVNARDNLGHTPLHNAYVLRYADARNEMVKVLIFSGSHAQLRDKNGYTPADLFRLLVQPQAMRDSQKERLHHLRRLSKEEMLEYMYSKPEDILLDPDPRSFKGVQADVIDPVTTPTSCHLTGVEVIGETNFLVQGRAAQTFEWERYGLRIHVPEGALPPDVNQCLVNIKVSLTGEFEFPDNSELVSAVYWISVPLKSCQPITLEMQHCVSIETASQCSDLSFAVAKGTGKDPPHQFRHLEGGVFLPSSSYGSISVQHFCGISIVQSNQSLARRLCYSKLFYNNEGLNNWKVDFVVTKNTSACITKISSEYEKADFSSQICFSFKEPENNVSLDISKAGIEVSCWKIVPLSELVIGKEEVEVGKDIARRNFRVSCEADSQPETLQHSVDVKGTDRDELFFTIFIRPSNRNTSPVMPAWKKPTLEKIKSDLGVDVIGGIGTKWDTFGIHLLHDPNGVGVQVIKEECLGNCEKINTAIIVRWLRGGEEGRPVTWAVLREALKKAGLETLAEEVSEALEN